MRKLLAVLSLLFLAACGSESSQQDASGEASSLPEAQQDLVGSYALNKSAFEDALLNHTLEGEKMDSLLMLTTSTLNDSSLAQPATRQAVYKDGDILIEDDRMAEGLTMRMEKM